MSRKEKQTEDRKEASDYAVVTDRLLEVLSTVAHKKKTMADAKVELVQWWNEMPLERRLELKDHLLQQAGQLQLIIQATLSETQVLVSQTRPVD